MLIADKAFLWIDLARSCHASARHIRTKIIIPGFGFLQTSALLQSSGALSTECPMRSEGMLRRMFEDSPAHHCNGGIHRGSR
jgi:hypothetical protein